MSSNLTVNSLAAPLGLNSGIFAGLLPNVLAWDSEFSETESAPVHCFDLKDESLILDGNSLPMEQDVRARLLAKAGAPVSYLSDRSINIQMLALQEHLQQGDFGRTPKAVLRNGRLFTIQRSDLVELTHSEVLTAVADALGRNAECLSLSRIDYADGNLELELVSPTKTREIRRGDVVKAGLHIEHCRFGDRATQVQAFNYRLVCANGMTRRECVSAEGIVRTRKLPANHPHAKELLLDQIRRLTTRTWDRLDQQLTELGAISERRADVGQLLRQWLQRARISTRVTDAGNTGTTRTVMDRLLTAWRADGAEDTYYAAVNALTQVGSHDQELTARQRRVLSLLGGLLAFSGVHICPKCFSVLSGVALAPEEHTPETAMPIGRTNRETTGLVRQ
jgi:hypothetical protein